MQEIRAVHSFASLLGPACETFDCHSPHRSLGEGKRYLEGPPYRLERNGTRCAGWVPKVVEWWHTHFTVRDNQDEHLKKQLQEPPRHVLNFWTDYGQSRTLPLGPVKTSAWWYANARLQVNIMGWYVTVSRRVSRFAPPVRSCWSESVHLCTGFRRCQLAWFTTFFGG